MTNHRRHAITYRNPATVYAILGYLADAHDEEGVAEATPWAIIIDWATSDAVAWKTAENILRELADFGAIRITGTAAGNTWRQVDSRAIYITTLGQHWLEQTIHPPLTRPGKDTDQ